MGVLSTVAILLLYRVAPQANRDPPEPWVEVDDVTLQRLEKGSRRGTVGL